MKDFFTDMADWIKVFAIALAYAVSALFFGTSAHALDLEQVPFSRHVIRVGVQPAVGEQKACVRSGL